MNKKVEDLTIKDIIQYCKVAEDDFCISCKLISLFSDSCYRLKHDKVLKMHLETEVDLDEQEESKSM